MTARDPAEKLHAQILEFLLSTQYQTNHINFHLIKTHSFKKSTPIQNPQWITQKKKIQKIKYCKTSRIPKNHDPNQQNCVGRKTHLRNNFFFNHLFVIFPILYQGRLLSLHVALLLLNISFRLKRNKRSHLTHAP